MAPTSAPAKGRDPVDPFALTSAVASLLLSATLLLQAWRIGVRKAPRTLLVLVIFLAVSGAAWIVGPYIGHASHLVQSLNVVMTGALVLLVLRARGIVSALVDARHRAKRRGEEYDRALHDYEQLMAHRISNPLTVISGAAHTLLCLDLPRRTREDLLGEIMHAAARLEHASTRPAVESTEERELVPAPRSRRRSATRAS